MACWSRHCEVSVVESAGGEYGIPLVVSNIIYKLLGKKCETADEHRNTKSLQYVNNRPTDKIT